MTGPTESRTYRDDLPEVEWFATQALSVRRMICRVLGHHMTPWTPQSMRQSGREVADRYCSRCDYAQTHWWNEVNL